MKYSNNIKIIKNIEKIVFRLIIFIIIILIILLIINYIILKVEQKDIRLSKEYIFYDVINEKINKSNSEKMNLDFWDYERKDYTVKIGNEKIGNKENKKRILVVGDSFIWGHAQDNLNNLWWRQLEYILKKNGYENVEVIAAGMNGFSIVDETEKIILNEEYMKKIEPDLVIIGFVSNDWEINDEKDEYYKDGIEEFEDNDKEEYIEEHLNNKIAMALKEKFKGIYEKAIELLMEKEYAKEEFKEKYGYSFKQKEILYNTEEYIKRIEKRAIEPVSNMNIPVLVVNFYYDSLEGNSLPKFKDKVFELLKKYGIENYDLENLYKKEFKNIEYNELKVNIADYHPGARLMNFYAKKIYNYLIENHIQTLGEKINDGSTSISEFQINDYQPSNINLKKIKSDEYTLNFPLNYEKLLQNYDTKESYVKLNLKYPVNIEKIELRADKCNIKSVKVDVYDEEKGYETEYDIELDIESIKENKIAYSVKTDKKITSIKISADSLKEQNCPIIIKVEKK